MKSNILNRFFEKINLDKRSLKFKLLIYFSFFSILVVILIWLLQIFFLNNYYEASKINETTKLAREISRDYISEGLNEGFLSELKGLAIQYDTEIIIDSNMGIPIYISKYDSQQAKVFTHVSEREKITSYLKKSNNMAGFMFSKNNMNSDSKTLAYGTYLRAAPGNETYLFLFTPLYPVSSTVSILRNQLIYITFITLALAFIFALYLSRRITRPLYNMMDSAVKLAEGEYGVEFSGEHYTELINLGATLNKTSRELQKTEQLRKDLMSNVSHDLRTPLTMVKSYAEMIRDLSGDNPEKRNKHLQVIIDETDRLNKLVNDVFTLSKMQSGITELDMQYFNLRDAVNELISTYGLTFEQQHYDIHLDLEEDAPVKGDLSKIKQVIANFINNAFKYCGDDKYIAIRLKNIDDGDIPKVRFEIEDHGAGISEEEVRSIWEKYYRASSNYGRPTSGTGLGLSIVSEILKAHNAEYGVESQLGKGSTFWFELTQERPPESQKQSRQTSYLKKTYFKKNNK